VDAEGIFVEINDTELEWLGYQREELVGRKNIQDILTPASRKQFQENFSRLKSEGRIQNLPIEFVRRDGTILPALVSSTALKDDAGAFLMSRAMVLDATELHKTEQLKSRLAAIVEASDDAIIGETKDRLILDWNAGAEAIFGYKAEEIRGQSMALLVPPDRQQEFQELTEKIRRGQHVHHFETVRLRNDGQAIHVSLNICPIHDPGGNLLGFATIARDITEHEKLDQALRQQERQVRQLLEAAPDAILQIDSAGRIVLANEAAERMFGYSRSELAAMLVEELVPMGARGAHIRHRSGYVGHPVTRPMGIGLQLKAQRKDGTLLPVEISLSPTRNGDLYVTAIVRDVTERSKAEDLLRQFEEKLRQAEKLEALARLAGGTAHEFNNLLTMVLGYAELLQPELARQSSHDYVEKIRAAAKRAAHLTRQLMAFGRRQTLRSEVLDLNVIVSDTGESLAPVLGASIKTLVALAPEPMWVNADPMQMQQMIANLAMNARDAMAEGGALRLALEGVELTEKDIKQQPGLGVGRYVRLTVTDTGSGMAPEVQARLFEPFFSTRQFGTAAGLGLAMVYGIVSQSGGAISVNSVLGQGTTFNIYLPRLDERPPAQERERRAHSDLRGTETLLLVEDQAHLLTLTREFLQRLGYHVLAASSAEEAIHMAETFPQPIHLLLTDIVMPGLNGRQLAKTLQPARPAMKVLYVSGYADEAFSESGVPGKDAAFLEKPYELEELAQKIREML
jgi:PAS domain S-box-containing protein